MIAGNSIGGIEALGYASGLVTPSQLSNFFVVNAPWIFTTSTSTPSQMPSTLTKINTMIGGNSSFYPSSTAGGTMRLKANLASMFGSKTLQDMKTTVLITSFEKNDVDPDFEKYTNTPVYFSNSKITPVLRGQTLDAVDVCMATAAAPLCVDWNQRIQGVFFVC